MEKVSAVKIGAHAISNDIPGLLSFINLKSEWSYLNSEWIDFLDTIHLNSSKNKSELIHPADLTHYNRIVKEAFERKKPFQVDVRIRKNSGEYSLFREIGKPVKSMNGELTGFTCHATNIDDIHQGIYERLKTENMTQTIMDYSSDMIVVYDKDLRLISINRKALETIGRKMEDVIGRTFGELFPNAKTSQGHVDLLKALGGEIVHNDVYDSKVTDRTFENFMFPLKDQNENIYAVLAIAHDITDHIKNTIELEKAYRFLEDKNRELERSNKELGSFTYVASHDMQEPLRKIQAFGKRIVEKEDKNLTETGRDYMMRMVDAANRMQKLIDSLLEFSRTTTATKKFELSDLNILIEEVKRENKFSIEEKQASIDVAPLPTIFVIPFQFKQVVANLLSNSLKYSKTGITPHIKITSDIIPSKKLNKPELLHGINYCRINFIDNGIGFPNEYASQIFELFQRLHGRGEYSGSGIGLSICKKIAENHEGFITAESVPGEGATFSLYLPMKH